MELLTPRLHLRPPIAQDFAAWEAFSADAQTMAHLGGVQHAADAWRSFAMMVGAWQLGVPAMFSVIERNSGAWVGRVGPWQPHLWPCREVGWGILRRFEGRGYALEAAVACLDHAFDTRGWNTVSHLVADANVRSRALAERLGAKPIGVVSMPGSLSGEQVTEWRQDRSAWQARRSQFDGLVPR